MAAQYVLAGLAAAGLAFWYDFKSWQSFGTGGTPPTLEGYIKIRRWGLYLLYTRQNLLDASPIPDTGASYINPQKVPDRVGSRPGLTRWTLPQRQFPEKITPGASTTLHDLMREFADTKAYSEYIETRPSKTEGGTGPAIYVKPDVKNINPVAHKIFYEVAHVHPAENSLHVYVSPQDARLVMKRGWGQRFPVTWLAPPSWIMVYAPRNEEEVETVREIVRAAHNKPLLTHQGPAGCALAHGLKKAGISFNIYDKGADVYRHRHWAFTLGWARPYLFDLIPEELSAQINSCQVDPYVDCAALGEDRIVIYNGQTREEAFAFPIPMAREINIRRLRMLLAEQLDVKYSKSFSHYKTMENGGVTVHFEDGTTDTGTLVIGLDGAMSKVRRCLLPHSGIMDTLPFALMNFNASYTASQALFIKEHLHPLVDIAIHPAGHYIRANVLDMPDEKDASTWTFQILSTWPLKYVEDHDNEDGRLERLKAHVKRDGWAEPYKSAIEWIPEDTPVLRDQLKIWKTVPWDNQDGRVTLCGDAAHAMTFHRGQGANNAFYSAHCLVEALKSVQSGSKSLNDAVTSYDESIWKRGANEVQISKAQTFFTHDGLEEFVNSPVMRLGTKPSHAARTEGYQ
ncbi:hypothetical protein J4E80_010198 [Alternaria sp. BMP 0032]|nr:hypothetical protein J4E80_010198 [Alternaria sp. BMP 0032]